MITIAQFVHDKVVGVGMDYKTIKQLLEGTEKQSEKGMGIRNTNTRLKRTFGVGLVIVSRPNEGTTVTMKIPLNQKSFQNNISQN